MSGGTLVALWMGKNDPGFVHNGPLAGLVAVCAGSDVMHPIGALIVGVFRNGLQLLGVESTYQVLITGILVIAAVSVDQLTHRK